MSFHAWEDSRLNPEATVFLRGRSEDLGARWAALVRAASVGDREELLHVRAARDADTPAPNGVRVLEITAPRIRLYVPERHTSPLQIVLYFHGGGWVLGSIRSCTRFCGELAAEAGVIVAAVEYRLAPEFRFPAALDDGVSAFLWMQEHAVMYGGDPDSIFCAGDSAGGNLAVGVALRTSAEPGFRSAAGLMLLYPVTTLVPAMYGSSWEEFGTGYGLDADLMEAFAEAFVSCNLRDTMYLSFLGAPADALRRLPPVLCVTAECDILRDQGRAFCDRLRELGVPVRYCCFPGAVHLFVTVPGMDRDFRRSVMECTAFLQNRSM